MTLQDRLAEMAPDMRRTLEAYMARTEQLDRILAVLTRPYCARCPRNARYGCCDFAEEAVREMPAEALALQEAESLGNGGNLQEVDGICRYHGAGGCSLTLTKSSSCLGHLCGDLKAHLVARHGAAAEGFAAAMGKLVTGSLEREPAALLEAMDGAIDLGRKLVQGAGGS